MKLLRVGEYGNEVPAILDDKNKIRNLSDIIEDFNPDNLNFQILDKFRKLFWLSIIAGISLPCSPTLKSFINYPLIPRWVYFIFR